MVECTLSIAPNTQAQPYVYNDCVRVGLGVSLASD